MKVKLLSRDRGARSDRPHLGDLAADLHHRRRGGSGTPVAASKVMNERIKGSQLVILPSAAHLSNLEQPEAFTGALLGFLNENSAS